MQKRSGEMELETERLRLIPCSDDFVSKISPKGYEIGPHIRMYLKELKADHSLLGWGNDLSWKRIGIQSQVTSCLKGNQTKIKLWK